jgi:hypothetical protein
MIGYDGNPQWSLFTVESIHSGVYSQWSLFTVESIHSGVHSSESTTTMTTTSTVGSGEMRQ